MAQYSYPGNNQRYEPPSGNRRKYQGCAPTRDDKKKNKLLVWIIFSLFAFDVLCQLMTQAVSTGEMFWWLGLGDDVLIFVFLMFLIAR